MKLKLFWLLLFALLLGVTLNAAAQEERSTGTPDDNACYAGGSLEGRCDWPTDAEDEWAWTCGWYIARAENAAIPFSGVPEWCNYFAGGASAAVCYASPGGQDFVLTGALNTIGNITVYNSADGSCSGGVYTNDSVVDASGTIAAETACASLFGSLPDMVVNLASQGYNTPASWWVCAYA